MKNICFASPVFYLIPILFLTHGVSAQTTSNSNPTFDHLLHEKQKTNTAVTITDKYKIQIFYGDSQNARKTLNDFKKFFPEIDATIIFSSPNYKVQVGNYRSKIAADRNRLIIREKFPDALVVKPSR